jgi:hypothetical protein
MGPRDLFDEAVAGIDARPICTALTMLGTVVGITTLVITLGVAATAGNQIAARFDGAPLPWSVLARSACAGRSERAGGTWRPSNRSRSGCSAGCSASCRSW